MIRRKWIVLSDKGSRTFIVDVAGASQVIKARFAKRLDSTVLIYKPCGTKHVYPIPVKPWN